MRKSTFLQICIHFGLIEQAFWRMPFFTEWSFASSFEVILARQSSHFPTWASASRTLVLDAFFTFCCARRSWRKDSAVSIVHAYFYRVGNCNCLLSNTAHWLSIANNILDFFVHAVLPLILDHGACFKISISGFEVLHSQTLLGTSFCNRLQSVIIRFGFHNPSKMSSNEIFVIDNKIPSPFRIEFLNIIISKSNCK